MISNSNVKLLIAITALISTTGAISCTPSSPDCCWVWKIRELGGHSMTGYSSKADSCCLSSIGVKCSGNSVTEIRFPFQRVAKPIPAEIGNLKSLTYL